MADAIAGWISAGSSSARLRLPAPIPDRQPDGGSAALGSSPRSTIRCRSRSTPGSGSGIAESSASVYRYTGGVEQFGGSGHLDQLPQVHDERISDVPHHAEIVRDQEVRQRASPVQLHQEVEDPRLDRRVERGHGLVELPIRVERARASPRVGAGHPTARADTARCSGRRSRPSNNAGTRAHRRGNGTRRRAAPRRSSVRSSTGRCHDSCQVGRAAGHAGEVGVCVRFSCRRPSCVPNAYL